MNKLFIFMAGAAVGSITTWKLIKTKYEQLARDEINSVKEVLYDRHNAQETIPEDVIAKANEAKEKPDIMEYAAKLRENGYTNYSNTDTENGGGKEDMNKPYVIPPEEFGETENYDVISLTYYADKVLADNSDNIVEDADEVVGLDSLSHFGEYEDDSVFVRNDRLKCDYEILLDTRKYSDVVKTNPHDVED